MENQKSPVVEMLHIASNGAEIVSTNYFSLREAQRGNVNLSGNAGTLRLLVPQNCPQVRSMRDWLKKTKLLSVFFGLYEYQEFAWQITFEDGTNNPPFLMFGWKQSTFLPPVELHHRTLPFSFWLEDRINRETPVRLCELQATIELVESIPYNRDVNPKSRPYKYSYDHLLHEAED